MIRIAGFVQNLENWVFSDSPEVEIALGWKGKELSLRSWLVREKYLEANKMKPARPKGN